MPGTVLDPNEYRCEPAQQPHQLNIAMRLVLYFTAGTNLVQISIDVQLQQITRLIGRPTCFLGSGRLKTQRLQIQAIDIDINATNGVRIVKVVVYTFGEKPDLSAVKPIDIAQKASSKTGRVFTRYNAYLGYIKEFSHSLGVC
jgi:hypothetical protein